MLWRPDWRRIRPGHGGARAVEHHDRRAQATVLIGPDEYRAAEKRASETGRTLIGFYHSHPNHPAVTSAFDLEHAWPNLRYLILSVRGGRPEEARTWRLREDRSAFDEETVVSQPERLRA
jgi:proteasome lid subunit RPN8/RPN11